MDDESGQHDDAHASGDEHEPKASAEAPAPAVDVAKLTARVYRLMLDDLRLERARGAGMRNK